MSILLILFFIIGSVYLGGYIYRWRAGKCRCSKNMNGKVVLITGASAGIGKYTALNLARKGAKIIMGCRNRAKAQVVADWITKETGNKKMVIYDLDVSDFDSVRSFAKQVNAKESRLDVLINNAGGAFPGFRESAQRFELTMATNHLGPFLLTHLLINLLQKAPTPKIINVSSLAHAFSTLDLSDLHCKTRSYNLSHAYAESKLANILFTKELHRRLYDKGITSYCLHPGTVSTEVANKDGLLLGAVISKLMSIIGKTAEEGAQTSIHLAISDQVQMHSGEYFVDCKVTGTWRKYATDEGLAKSLWRISEHQVELNREERIPS